MLALLLPLQSGSNVHGKSLVLVISCLQRLITHNAVPSRMIPMMLGGMSDLVAVTDGSNVNSSSMELLLKILQTALPLLTNYNLRGELVGEVLLLCFKLHDSKLAAVASTAAATLRQMVVFMFEMVMREDEPANNDSDPCNPAFVARYVQLMPQVRSLRACALDAHLLFHDLCALSSGESAVFLRLETLNRTFGLELIESVISTHHAIFLKVC